MAQPADLSLSEAARHGVVPMEEQHLAQVLKLYGEIFGEPKAKRLGARFDRQYRRSPARRPEQPANWVLVRGGRVVGHLGLVFIDVKVNDAVLQGAWAVDLMVHPDHRRSKGLPHLFSKLDSCAELPMGYGMAEVVGRIYRRRGYIRWEVGSHLVHIRNLVGVFRFRVGAAHQRDRWGRLWARLGSWRSSLSAYQRGLPGRRRLRSQGTPPSVLSTEECTISEVSTEELDALWCEVGSGYPLAVIRSGEYLAWRYGDNAETRSVVVREGDRLVACLITETFLWRGLRVVQVSEWLVPRGRAESLIPELLRELFRILDRERADALLTEGLPEDLRRVLKSWGLVELDENRREIAVLLRRNEAVPLELAADPNHWLCSPGDSDRSTLYPRVRWRTECGARSGTTAREARS